MLPVASGAAACSPPVLYGPGAENVSLGLEKKDIFSILKSESGENTLFKVAFDSEKRDVMIKDSSRMLFPMRSCMWILFRS